MPDQTTARVYLFDPKLNDLELQEFKEDLGRKTLVYYKIADNVYLFLNIYAPNVAAERIDFSKELPGWLMCIGTHDLIIGADWNTVLDLKLD